MGQCPFPTLAQEWAFIFWTFHQERSTVETEMELSISDRQQLASPIPSFSLSSGMSLMLVSFRFRLLPLSLPPFLVFRFFLFSCVSLTWSKQSNGWVLGGRDSCCLNVFKHSLPCPGTHCSEGAACNRIMLVPLLS